MSEADRQRREAEQAIRAAGRRVTAQRVLILEALQALPGHQTVDAIHEWVQARDAEVEMALSTVYRTLDALSEIGLITAFDAGSRGIRYEWAGDADPHHHLVCDRCGRRVEVELEAVVELEQEVERRYGFSAGIRHLAIRGECAACRSGKRS